MTHFLHKYSIRYFCCNTAEYPKPHMEQLPILTVLVQLLMTPNLSYQTESKRGSKIRICFFQK